MKRQVKIFCSIILNNYKYKVLFFNIKALNRYYRQDLKMLSGLGGWGLGLGLRLEVGV